MTITQQRIQKNIARMVVGLLMLGFSAGSAFAQVHTELTHEFELEEVLSIGDNEEAPREYLFTNPEHIRTDADGRIYVVEGQRVGSASSTKVRVFGPDGEFLGALGRRGGGPGEFKSIVAIALDANNRLVTYDNRLDRFTRFPPFETLESFPRPDPDRIETIPNPETHRLGAVFMYGLPEGRLVIFYQGPRGKRSPDQPRLHVYDESFDETDSFGKPIEWSLSDDKWSQHITKTPILFGGSHVAPDASSLLLAPWPYKGFLFRYAREGDGTWTLQRLKGRDPGHPTHEVVESRDSQFSFFTSAGIGARYRSASHGVGQLSDGRVVHLSTSEDENGIRQLQLELFSPDGTLQKVGRIDGFVHDKTEFSEVNEATSVNLLWVDRRDRLYLVDRRSGFPVIRVMKLEE